MIQVVVGVIPNAQNEILVTQRPVQKSWSGYWEFPGGKKEPQETAYQTLVRELKEELDIEVLAARAWKQMTYTYPERTVELNLWIVTEFKRQPQGMEEQAFQWIALNKLEEINFLPANKIILQDVIREFS